MNKKRLDAYLTFAIVFLSVWFAITLDEFKEFFIPDFKPTIFDIIIDFFVFGIMVLIIVYIHKKR